MDKIIFSDIVMFGYHGNFSQEKDLGQRFFIDAELTLDLQKAGQSDKIADTINYADVYEVIRLVVEEEKHNLIESVGEKIVDDIFQEFPQVSHIEIQVKKPSAPIKGIFNHVAIKLSRTR